MTRSRFFSGLLLFALSLVTPGPSLIQAAPLFSETAYFSEQPDLPLPPGFQENPTAGIIFDQGPIRIAEFVATGSLSPTEITRFYANTLPMLGWVPSQNQTLFQREKDQLTLQVQTTPNGTLLRLRLEPVPLIQDNAKMLDKSRSRH